MAHDTNRNIFVASIISMIEEYQVLKQYIQRFTEVTEEEQQQFVDAFELNKIKKRQYIFQPGFVAKQRHYVLKGAFRTYVIGENGQDHTIAFAVPDWWITEYNSYINQQRATLFVMALEDSLTLSISYEKEKELKSVNHKFETIFRNMAERGLAFQQKRLISNLTLTAEERYDEFMDKYAKVATYLPQYALASYLNMTPEFLSKIRNKKVKKK